MAEIKVNLGYKPDAILFYCSDGRFFEAHEAEAEHHGTKSPTRLPDRLVLPGPAESIVNEQSRKLVIPRLAGLVKLHSCTEISMWEHLNCGWMSEVVEGYKEADMPSKVAIQTRYLRMAKGVLEQEVPNLKVNIHLRGIDQEIPLA